MSNLDVAVNVISDKETQLTVKVPVGTIQSKVESRIRSLAKTAKIDGFRKGKVPVSHIRAQYGAGIQQEVINDVIRDTVFEVLADKKVRAVGVPSIDDVKLENDFLVYQASVETMPEVEVKGLSEIEVERQVATVSDEDVDTMIENLQKQRQTFEAKDGELADGDEATFDFEGSIDGEKFEGGSAENFRLIIGSGQMIPGFEDGMKGMKAGEEKTIKVTFPEDYQAENLKGKEADFKITVKEVKEAKLPELNDEFFELFGVSEGGLDKLKADVRKNMEREIKSAARNQVKQAAFDALVEKNEFDVPNAMLAGEIDRQRNLMLQRFAQQFGANPNTFDKNMLPDELFEDQALRAVRLGVLVGQIIDKQKLEVDQERVTAFIAEAAENYEDPDEVIEYYTNDKQERAGIEAVVLEDQVVEYILSQGKVTDKEVKYQDLLAAAQQAQM
ncbi:MULTISPECIES: trigger factor [Moraxella]|uniref:Trigger factor n=1 Tax=Moraxella lacunata TaxID=477 RepID=A0A1B8Q4Z2_MORLA|nr:MULTISPECIES: trigger factor [Moraxella]MBE9577831.1 trigger factor [Moraxella sp. K1664]MBE9587253.1 trigger factor [Moraxella sp. K1630]MBE9590567.1 trigger factor [Moraxella sp. K127]MBE9595595.1 trigger factor [Moraxella sp. K2450]MDH9219282.1 trigger factor [Moraxella lacunata]